MEYEIMQNRIFYFKNAIPRHAEIITVLEENENDLVTPWIPWGNKYAESQEQKKSVLDLYGMGKVIYDPDIYDKEGKLEKTNWVYRHIKQSIDECSEIYKKHMNIDEEINPRIPFSGFVIGKYDENVPRGLHSDCPYDDLEHSYVVYLNDNYEGGELNFPELNINFKPEAGSVVMFKSMDVDHIHQAGPATNGYKYIIPHFWRMGPSQGFIPYGNDVNKYINDVINREELIHDFDNLKVVEEKNKIERDLFIQAGKREPWGMRRDLK